MPKKINYNQIITEHMKTLEKLRAPSGLFRASSHDVGTGYDKAWIRDNFYECLPFVILGKWDIVEETYNSLLEIFIKHEYKIDHAIENKPQHRHEYIHARYHPETFDEFWEDWGNKQNDAVGCILYMIGELEAVHGKEVANTKAEKRIIQKLIDYLVSLEYWHDPDSGIWENEEEIHASSIGACVAGLESIARLDWVDIDKKLIQKGKDSLAELLPRESMHKFVDLALLTLIYPYKVTTEIQTEQILENIQYHLVRKNGVVRYKNDFYYNKNPDGHSQEAEWCFGFSWLAIIYTDRGNKEMARKYLNLAMKTLAPDGSVPELYFSNSDEYNENTPLGWSESMYVIALHKFKEAGYSL